MFDEQIEVFAQIPRIYTREQEEYQIMSEWSKTIQLKVVNFDLCAIICYAIWNTNNNRIRLKMWIPFGEYCDYAHVEEFP